jgi:hypothetical protein
MKKIVFLLSLVIAVGLTIDIAYKLFSDYDRLNSWGFGYITGKVIFLLIFLLLAYFTGIRKRES